MKSVAPSVESSRAFSLSARIRRSSSSLCASSCSPTGAMLKQMLEEEIRRAVEDMDRRLEDRCERGSSGRLTQRVVGTGFRMARDFGASSPSTMCRKVMIAKAIANDAEVMTAGDFTPSIVKDRMQHVRDERLADPTEREARERDAELGGGKIGIEMRDDMPGEAGVLRALMRRAPRAGCRAL